MKGLPNHTKSYKEIHGRVAVILEFLFDGRFIKQLSWSEMNGNTSSTKICLANHHIIFDLVNDVLAKKVDSVIIYQDAEDIRKSFQHYFRHRARKEMF